MNQQLIQQLKRAFLVEYGEMISPVLIFAPGRINVLGEHVDYNGGSMLPAAIDKGIYILADRRNDEKIVLHSLEFNELVHVDLNESLHKSDKSWANYLIGVMAQFQKLHIDLPGFNLVFAGDLPIGAGMSSSAAVETGVAYLLNEFTQSNLPTKQLVQMSQKAEHEFAGVMCGMMDQFASMMGKENRVVMFDSITLDHKYLSADLGEFQFLLLDSKVKHSLASSAYNTRRQESEYVLKTLQNNFSGIDTFRDATIDQFNQIKSQLDEVHILRGKYVIEEIDRVRSAEKAFDTSDWKMLGQLMNATHAGLSKEYEVSCPELDYLWELAGHEQAILGARMMGGGFGGCTINLIKSDQVAEVTSRILNSYQQKYGIEGAAYAVSLSDGTRKLNLNML